MTRYIVEAIEGNKTTSAGKSYHKVTLVDPATALKEEQVAIWQDFPFFQTISLESEVEGDIVKKPSADGKFVNKTLYPPRPQRTFTGTTRGAGGIAKAQETKREDIKNAQENKEVGIKLSSTIRMAVDITLARMPNSGLAWETETIQAEIDFWRKELWRTWDEPVDRNWDATK